VLPTEGKYILGRQCFLRGNNCRNCKRLREFEEKEISRQSCRGDCEKQGEKTFVWNLASGEITFKWSYNLTSLFKSFKFFFGGNYSKKRRRIAWICDRDG
jgi:hypothetical protein